METTSSSIKVLIADDESIVRKGLKSTVPWAKYGMEVVADAANGRKAWEAFQEHQPQVVITDIVMPEMDGIELARRAAELDPDIKIMFITGFAAVALNSDSNAPKHAKVLSKPIHLRELVNEVQKMLAA